MQGVSLLRTGQATPQAAQIEAGRLRLDLDPSALSLDLRDARSPLVLDGITPRVDAVAQTGGALAIGPHRMLSVGELKGRAGPVLRLEVQAVGRGLLGVRWTLEVAGSGSGVSCTLAVENRTGERLLLRSLAPLARGSKAPERLTGNAPSLPVHVLQGTGAPLALGFTTELRHRTSLRITSDASPPSFSLENEIAERNLEPGESVESERAWLALGTDEASLLAEWARLAGLEMDARVPGRAVVIREVPRHSIRQVVQELRQFGDPVVIEPEGGDTGALQEFAIEARAGGAIPGVTLGDGTLRPQRAAHSEALRAKGFEHVAGRAKETTLASVGLIDTLRLEGARGAPGVASALDLAFSGQRLWRLDPGPILLQSGLPPSQEERTRFCVFALAGGALRVTGDPRELDAVRAGWLRLATPGLARPALALPIAGGRALVVSLIGGRLAVLLVNESNETRSLGTPFDRLGVAGPHHVFDFWAERALGVQEEIAPDFLAPGGSRLLALTPLAPRPQLIGSSLHLGMGCLEASGLRAREDGALGLTLRLPGRRSGALWIAFPNKAFVRRIPVSFEDTLSLMVPGVETGG